MKSNCSVPSGYAMTARVLTIALSLFALTSPPNLLAQQSIEAKADRIINAAMKEKRIPGLVLAIVKDGRVVVKKGYGVKKIGSPEVPDENTVFSIGSLSKALTAFGAMRLVDEGKLDLDARASNYVKGMPQAWRPITVRQFMTHTSGIPQIDAKLPTLEAMFRKAASMKMSFPPGSDQDYNNFNFAVTGAIIESISGEPYLTYMQRRVFAPLGMSHTGQSGTVSSRNRATGYALRGGKAVAVSPEPKGGDFAIPSGFLESTLADLLKFNDAIRTHALVKPHTDQEMITPSVVKGKNYTWSFTPGWQERKAGAVTVVAKNGAVVGFSSQFQFVPERGDAVIMIWNVKGKGLDMWDTVSDLLAECLDVPRARDVKKQ